LHDGFFDVEKEFLGVFGATLLLRTKAWIPLLALLRSRSLFQYFSSAIKMKA
jgi:hypothetical protein